MLEPHLATADAGVWAHDGAGISVAVPELVSMPWVALRSAVAVVVVVAAVDAVGAVVAVEVVAAAVVVVVVAVATWAAVFHTWSQWQWWVSCHQSNVPDCVHSSSGPRIGNQRWPYQNWSRYVIWQNLRALFLGKRETHNVKKADLQLIKVNSLVYTLLEL